MIEMIDPRHEGAGIETSFIDPDSQAQCPACGWKGPWRPSEQEAAQDLIDHFDAGPKQRPAASIAVDVDFA